MEGRERGREVSRKAFGGGTEVPSCFQMVSVSPPESGCLEIEVLRGALQT